MKLKAFIIGIIIILGVGFGLFAREATQTVRIVVEGESTDLEFWGFTVQDALAAAQIPLAEGDLVTPPLENQIATDEVISISRAAWVVILTDGKASTLWTADRIPMELFSRVGLRLSTGDQVFWNGQLIDPQIEMPFQNTNYYEILRATTITLTDGRETKTFFSTTPNLSAALAEADIVIGEHDLIEPAGDTALTGQTLQVTIQRAVRISIRAGENEIEAQVVAATVGEALSVAGMSLQGLDYAIPADTEPLPSDGVIEVIKVREEVLLEQDLIPFGFEQIALPDVDLDTRQVIQTGEYGITARRIRVGYENEIEVSREVEAEWVAKYPEPRIEGYGTKITFQTAQTADGPIQYYRKLDVYATSYSPCNIGIPGKCGTHTASGKVPQKGMIAVIRSWYNQTQGQSVYVNTYGYATIEDIGAGFSDRHWIDLAWTDEEYAGWSGWVTLYFLAPVPANVMWILE
jgi:resuscitation-promoting factor RpfB